MWPRFRIDERPRDLESERTPCGQNLQLLEAQFEFLGHLRPHGFRNVRKIECYVLVLEICECHLSEGNTLHVYKFSSGKSRTTWSAASSPAALLRYALITQSRYGRVPSDVCDSCARGSTLTPLNGTLCISIAPALLLSSFFLHRLYFRPPRFLKCSNLPASCR